MTKQTIRRMFTRDVEWLLRRMAAEGKTIIEAQAEVRRPDGQPFKLQQLRKFAWENEIRFRRAERPRGPTIDPALAASIVDLARAGIPTTDIYKRVREQFARGLSFQTVAKRAARARRYEFRQACHHAPAPGNVVRRACLTCAQPFDADGRVERICPSCKGSELFRGMAA